jgi:hypothetical protein
MLTPMVMESSIATMYVPVTAPRPLLPDSVAVESLNLMLIQMALPIATITAPLIPTRLLLVFVAVVPLMPIQIVIM